MIDFFDQPELNKKNRAQMRMQPTCSKCNLFNSVNTPNMKPYGKFKKRILNIGEAPGKTEDMRGRQWQGKVGRRLQNAYAKLGFDLFRDCLNINAINCRPTDKLGNNRSPTNREINACRSKVLSLIEEHKPRVVMLFGGAAVQCFLGHRWKKELGGITKWRGWTIPDRDYKAWVCPQFHPSYIERGEKEYEKVWMDDLARALVKHKIKVPIPEQNEYDNVIIKNNLEFLDHMSGPIAIDFETTGLKPQMEGHRIVCISICDSEHRSYAFMMPRNSKDKKLLRWVLTNPKIRKIGQNIKFEQNWAREILGYEIRGWAWDTMLTTHILDNRRKVTSLKFQTYVNFGIVDYDSALHKYLESKEKKNANSFNTIDELIKKDVKSLLKYCGMDTIFTYKLFQKQVKQLA